MASYLEVEVEGPLSQPVEAAGEGSNSGATRMAVVELLERLTLATLEKHIKEWRVKTARPVDLLLQSDKMTSSWLLSHPTAHCSLSSPIFQEGLAMVLALPSPACKDRVGEVLGDRRVDIWGDEVRNVTLAGTTFTPRHDWSKMELMRMLGWSQIPASCEVRGLFQALIPEEATLRPEVRLHSTVMVPDFRIELPSSTPGQNLLPQETDQRLAELKFTCSKGHYKSGVRQRVFKRAVEHRSVEVESEYQRKADAMDRLLGEEEGRGRMRRRLDQFGELITIVVGKFNELSDGGHFLLDAMAASRVAYEERSTGLLSKDKAARKGEVQGELRRQLSTVNLRAGMQLLLNRLHQVGEGARLQSKAHEWTLREEERMREEREGQWAARVRGRTLLKKGHIFLS